MRLFLRALLLVGAAGSLACASVRVRPADTDDYIFPSWRPGELRGDVGRELERAWREVLDGRTAAAERRLRKLLERAPARREIFETALAYARLRVGRLEAASSGFQAALLQAPAYAPALAGAGVVALRRGEWDRALELYRQALAGLPQDASLRRRVAELKLQVTERRVGAARAARAEGRPAEAIAEYRAALAAAPELAEVRLELSEMLAERGELGEALAALEGDPEPGRAVLLRLGELLTRQGEYERALETYRLLLARDPEDAETLRRADEVRGLLEFARMPEEYRRIHEAARVSRAELAALISVKLTALARVMPGPTRVAVDISGSWAREHIVKLLSLDILELYPNHTFQPGATVRRGDLARAVGKVLALLGWNAPAKARLSDMSPNNFYYDGASQAVAAGLMDLTPAGAFEPWRPVSGAEAVAVLDALVRLVGP